MAPAKTLDAGEECSFPTWCAGTQTKVYVQNLENYEAEVVIQAGAASGEVLTVAAGERTMFPRDFGGVILRVINQNGTKVKVWTV
jgi:hypothetical protein